MVSTILVLYSTKLVDYTTRYLLLATSVLLAARGCQLMYRLVAVQFYIEPRCKYNR